MATVKIIYESKYGQTQKIAERIASFVKVHDHVAEVREVSQVDIRRLGEADAYVVLAPVYLGKHPKAISGFVARHGDLLNARPSAFVSVSGSAGSSRPRDRDEARERAVRFLATTSWRPNLVSIAGGAIAYPRYDFFTRLVMKAISKREGRSTDTSQTHELTDWDAIHRLTLDLLAFVKTRAAKTIESVI